MYFFQFVLFAAFIAAANAGAIGFAAAPLAVAPVAKVAAPVALAKAVVPEEYDPHPQYSFAYDIQDGITGDSKSQHETRDGNIFYKYDYFFT